MGNWVTCSAREESGEEKETSYVHCWGYRLLKTDIRNIAALADVKAEVADVAKRLYSSVLLKRVSGKCGKRLNYAAFHNIKENASRK